MTNENAYANAIEKIQKLAVAGEKVERYSAPDGKEYLISRGENGGPIVTPLNVEKVFYPDTMEVNTLWAFVTYLKAAIQSGEITARLYINIESPTHVSATTEVNKFGKRSTVAVARRYHFNSFNFGNSFDYESFIVALRSQFIKTEGMEKLLDCLKSITSSNDLTNEDNGVSQTVVARNGVSLGAVNITPVWELQPHRTFTEVKQPSSLFLFRIGKRGDETRYTLHETDGNAWAIDAIVSIHHWLCEELKEEIGSGAVVVL